VKTLDVSVEHVLHECSKLAFLRSCCNFDGQTWAMRRHQLVAGQAVAMPEAGLQARVMYVFEACQTVAVSLSTQYAMPALQSNYGTQAVSSSCAFGMPFSDGGTWGCMAGYPVRAGRAMP